MTRSPDETRAGQDEQRLTEDQVQTLAGYGRELRLEEGDLLFDERAAVDSFYVVLEGGVSISRLGDDGGTPFLVHRAGEFTGGLTVLTGKSSVHRAQAVVPSRVLEIDAKTFRLVAAEQPEVADVFIGGLARRMRASQRAFRQQEKLAALGKLSAGLAHELNNPAAAARRASEELGSAVLDAQLLALRHDERFPPETRAGLAALRREITGRPDTALDPLSLSDAEEALALWLEGRDVEDAWDLAPTLAASAVEEGDLEDLSRTSGAAELSGAVRWLAVTLELAGLTREVSAGVGRVSKLVGAMKEYTSMDRAGSVELDVTGGLEDTLTVLGHRLDGIEVARDYKEGLPKVSGNAGELNQVWTNLLENAADAVEDGGSIEVRAFRDGGSVVVEIEDDGPGIPREARNRVFEPFFTTRPVGSGAGMGLDIVRRVVAGHGGEVSLESGPDGTRFRGRLPAVEEQNGG